MSVHTTSQSSVRTTYRSPHRSRHDEFERLIAENYEELKDEVLATVRGKLAADNLHPDPLDLDAAYNGAWHALYERHNKQSEPVANLGGWLALIAYRRAIDDIRRSRLQHHVQGGEEVMDRLGYEPDLDEEVADRDRYRQWLLSLRLRLNARERQAVSLCVLHEHSRREASEIMGIDIKRLDKIIGAANRKLDGLVETISRGDWCRQQQSLIKAFALGLHDDDGERRELAIHHVMGCPACASYVRSIRGLTGILPVPAALGGALGPGGGVGGTLASLFGGGASSGAAGGAAGGGGAVLLGGLGAKGAALCASAVCAAGGVMFAIEHGPKRAHEPPPSPAASATGLDLTSPSATRTVPTRATSTPSSKRSTSGGSSSRTPPDPRTAGAQQIAELGIEPQATSTTGPSSAASVPTPPRSSEFDFEGP